MNIENKLRLIYIAKILLKRTVRLQSACVKVFLSGAKNLM